MKMDDYLVPSLEDLEENPLIRDSFIGVAEPPVKWPPGVEFVEADGSASIIDASEFVIHYPPSQQQQQQQLPPSYVQSTPTFGGRRRQESFNLGHLLTTPDSSQQPPLQPFLQQKNLPDNIDGSQFQQQGYVDSGSGANGGPFEGVSWLEDKTDLALLSGWIGDAATIDDFPEGPNEERPIEVVHPPTLEVGEGVVEKDQILQEIVRECEEIERRSSPGSEYPSSSSSPSSFTSPSSSIAPSPRFTWTARPVATFAFKRPQATTLTLEQAASALQPKDVKARSKMQQKEKKKAQNREAATRYREKKRRERDDMRGDLQILEARNQELKTQVDDYQYEIDYLRNLMHEIGIAK